jgi:hypothetical protein
VRATATTRASALVAAMTIVLESSLAVGSIMMCCRRDACLRWVEHASERVAAPCVCRAAASVAADTLAATLAATHAAAHAAAHAATHAAAHAARCRRFGRRAYKQSVVNHTQLDARSSRSGVRGRERRVGRTVVVVVVVVGRTTAAHKVDGSVCLRVVCARQEAREQRVLGGGEV